MQYLEKHNFVVEDMFKLALLSYGTFGVYNMYYFYRNFKLNEKSNEIVLLVKSILYPLFCFRLISIAEAKHKGQKSYLFSVFIVALLVLFVFSASIFSEGGKYLSLLTFFPLVIVNHLFQKADENYERRPCSLKKYSNTEKFIVFFGGIITSFILFSAF